MFTQDELMSRRERLSEAMDRVSIDHLLVKDACNIYYLTGFPFAVIQGVLSLVYARDGQAHWIGRRTDMSQIRLFVQQGWSDIAGEIDDAQDDYEALFSHVSSLVSPGDRLGVELSGHALPPSAIPILRAALGAAEIVDSSGLIEALRAVKSPQEIAYMRQAGEISAAAIHGAQDDLRRGDREADLAASLMSHAVRKGSDYFSLVPFVTSGLRSARAHSSWTTEPIEPGTVINTEIACTVARYAAPLFRVAVLGPGSDQIRRQHDASVAGLMAGLEGIGPGMTAHDADFVVREAISRCGYLDRFPVRAAYGVGINFPPDWSEQHVAVIKPGHDLILKPGMTFHLVPGLYDPEIGCTCCSMTIAVTADGVEALTPFPPELVELPM